METNEHRIPTAARPQTVTLASGGTVSLRRIRASVQDKILELAEFRGEGDAAGASKFSQLAFRWGCVRAENVPDPENPEEMVAFSTEVVRGIGNVANVKIYDAVAINEADYAKCLAIILGDKSVDGTSTGGALTEGQAGNSGRPRPGSTGGESA